MRLRAPQQDKRLAYTEKVDGFNALDATRAWTSIPGLAIGFYLPTDAEVRFFASGLSPIVQTAGNRVKVGLSINGTRKAVSIAQIGAYNASQTSQFPHTVTLTRTLRVPAGYNWCQVVAMHETQGSSNSASSESIWGDSSNFTGSVNEEGAMVLEATLV